MREIRIGDVYRIRMSVENGIVPKPGDESRNKYFIVLGFDSDGCVYGGVIINSRINANMPLHIKDWHMPIKRSKYGFLDHDSFVDCSSLKRAPLNKFHSLRYLGLIDEEDVRLILGTIKESPQESRAHLARFGIL